MAQKRQRQRQPATAGDADRAGRGREPEKANERVSQHEALGAEATALSEPQGTRLGTQSAAGGALAVASWELVRSQAARMAVLVVLAAVMGMTFNASSPVGIAWRRQAKAAENGSAAVVATESKPVAAGVPAAETVAPRGAPRGESNGGAASVLGGATPVVEQSLTNLAPMEWRDVKTLQAAGRAVLVDARAKAYYDLETIPGAVSMSVFGKPEEFEAFAKKYPTNTVLVTFCGSSSCPLSHHLAEKLAREFGFARVHPMTTGYLEWKRDEGGGFEPRREAFPTTWGNVAKEAAGGGVVFVDVRSASEFEAGHMPGAVSLPEGATAEQWAAFGKRVGKDRPLVVYGSRTGMIQPLQMGTRLMTEGGYRSVQYLREGYVEWKQLQAAGPAGGRK